MNPELILADIAIAIKHRTISTTHKWHIVFFEQRICCVPAYWAVPDNTILGTFSEQQTIDGFTVHEWENLKTRFIEISKELNK